MFKCNKCIFYNEEGYKDMGCTIPECKLKLVEQQRLKIKGEKYDLFEALIQDELQAEQCNYFTYISEAVDIIKSYKK